MLLIAGLAACNANKDATPSGTNVLDWDTSKTTRPAFKTAAFDGKQVKDQSMTFAIAEIDQVKLKVHVETATAKYQEDGNAMQLAAVTAISATVEDGKDYTFSAGKCTGPNYDLASADQRASYTILDCQIAARKPHIQGFVFFQMKGDGTILPPTPAK
jgi:hypothetical protein